MRLIGVIIMVLLLGACSSGEAFEGEWNNTESEETLTLTNDTFEISESGMSIEGELEHVEDNRYVFKTETQGDLNLSMSVDDDDILHLYNAEQDETEQYERME